MRMAQILINSVDVSAYVLDYNVDKAMGDNEPVDEATIKVKKTISAVVTLTHSQSVEIWSGYVAATDKRRFYGTIMGIERQGAVLIIKCYSRMHDAVKQIVAKDYDAAVDASAGKISEILKDLINTYTDILTADSTSVDDSGTALILTKFQCRYTDVLERCQALAKVLDWLVWYDHGYDLVYFKPKKYVRNANTIYIGGASHNVGKWESWKEDTIGFMCNDIYLHGGRDLVQYQEKFNGDGSTKTFTLEQVPESVKATLTTTIQRGGKSGSTSTYDYTVDTQNKSVTFTAAPPIGSSNVIIDYSYALPVPIQYSDPLSIETYGRFSRVFTLPDVTEVEDAQNRAMNYVNAHKSPARSINLTLRSAAVRTIDPEPGQEIYINDALNNVIGYFLITRIVETWPEDSMRLKLGDREWRDSDIETDSQLRLKRLEEQFSRNEDVLSIARVVRHPFTLKRKSFTFTNEFICDSFVIGNPINGLLGQTKKLDNFEGDVTTNWTSAELTISKNSTAATVKTGTYSMGAQSASAQAGYITTTQSFGDISAKTGAATGTPTKGTAGFWLYVTAAGDITSVKLRLGSGASDYLECTGGSIEKSTAYGGETLDLQAGWNYILFDLDAGAVTGTPDWAACDYARIELAFSKAETAYIDRFTCSKSNYVPNGLGSATASRVIVSATYA